MTLPYAIVVLGTSQGGLNALTVLLGGLTPQFGLPLAIVQHRSPDNDGALCRFLSQYSAIPIVEAEDKMPVAPGRAYLAPADYHLLLDDGHFALSTEGPVNSARPSIDVLFESAAETCGSQAIGVVLTGASHDGATGLARIKAIGGLALVQDPATAESPLMPEAAMAATSVDYVLTIEQIVQFLVRLSGSPGD